MKKIINLIKSQLSLQKNTSHKAAKELSIPTVKADGGQTCDGQSQCKAKAKVGFIPENSPIYYRVDSLSILSRQSDLAKYVATLAVLLCLSIGNVWGGTTETITVITNGTTTSSGIMKNKANSQTGSTLTGCTVGVTWTTNSSSISSTYYAQLDQNASAIGQYNFMVTVNSGYKINSIKYYLSNTQSSNTDTDYGILAWDDDLSIALTNPSYAATGATFNTKKGTFKNQTESFTSLTECQINRVIIYRKISGVTYGGNSNQTYGTKGKTLIVQKVDVTVEQLDASCTAPDHVNVTGRWDRFAGETINLTATAYDGSDAEIAAANITGYQWQKLEGSTWTNVSNGTVSGATTTGATAKNLQITNCGAGNSGKYRCVVSTGATCSTPSATKTDGTEGFGVKVYVLECYNDGTKTCSFTRTGDTQAGTATLTLAANTAYTFKFHVDNTYYGNNASINTDITNYVFCNSDNGGTCASNFTVNSGLGGTFTFAVEYSTGGNSSVEGEPELSVTYPRKTIYLAPNSDWLSNSAKFAYYYFHKTGDDTDAEGWTGFLTADDCGRHADIPQWNGVKVIAVRFNSSKTSTGNWDDKWNQTDDITVTSNDLITITGWNNSQTYTAYSPSTYTITFAGNGNTSGSMTNVSSIPCGEDRTLADNAFVKTDNIFDGWKANVDVTIGGANVTAGTLISDGATLQNIHSNITLTAQWTACSGPTINSFVPSGKTDGTYPVGTALGTLTVTASAGNGGALSYLWYQYDGGNIGAAVAAAGTNNAATYSIPNNAACVDRHYYCVVSEAGCSTTRTSDASGALTLTEPIDPCSEPAEVTNEIARFFVPCGLSNATSGSPSAWDVTQDASTDDNTFTTSGFGPTWYRNATSGLIYGKLNGNGSYIQLELKSGNFQAGDVVTIYINRDNSTKHGLKLKNQSTGNTISISSTASGVEASGTYTIVAADIEADGSLKFFREGSSSYVNRIIVTRAPVGPSITATKTSPDYVTTDPGNLQLSISTTGASSGWYYRVKNTGNGGYQTPDNTPYNTATWTMTSGLALGANNFVVELYNGSGVKQAESGTITVTAETAYPITIAAGAGGSVSPSGEIKANESGNHIHPAITATPSSGYHFVNWTYSNANATVADASSASTTISNAVGACTITANFEEDAPVATPMITWNLNVGTSATTTIFGSGDSDDHTNIPVANITVDQTNDGANGAGADNRTTKIAIKTGANGADWSEDPTNYEIFKFKVACGKKLTPSKISIPVANVGSSSANNIKYKAVLSDTYGHSLSGTYVVTTQDGTVESFEIDNSDASKYFQGEVTLKLWAWTIANKSNGGSAFRMGTPVEIYGAIGNQATPAATITWTTQPADGMVGDDDFAYAVSCSDGSTVTVTSNNTSVATIVGGKLHYAAAGTTYLIASATDACGNVLTPVNSNNFTVSVPATYSVTHTLTNVTATSGATGASAATEGVAYNAVFAASSGYDLPSTITVTIGGAAATAGTDYTWNSSTGAFEVPAAKVTGDIVVTIVGPEHVTSECITITNFETSQHNNSSNKPDSQGKYIYGYKTTVDAEHAVTITMSNSNNKGQNSNADMLVQYGTSIYIYADNTTTGGTPATFSNVTSVSLKIKNKHATKASNITIKVGSTTIANAVSLSGANNSTYTTYTYNNLTQLGGKIEIHNGGSGSTDFNFFIDDIEICTADMPACTTPVIPSLSNQALCSGNNAAAWNATQTASLATGETVSYQWQKQNGANWDDISGATSATYDVSDAVTEAMAGTYRVVVTVSKAGYSSSSATREVTLSVTESTEVTGITANKATVYPGNSVTLTATANTTVTWQWYTCSNSAGDSESEIGGATSAAYTISSAGSAGTYYYKAKATSSCGTDEMVYTLTVSAASECENYYWFIYADDATNNGVINNRDGFFSNTSTGTGNTGTYTMTVDGVSMTGTKRLSTAAYAPKFTVPAGATATLYIYGKAASSDAGKHLVLKRTSDDEEVEVTSNTTVQGYTKENIEAGEWTLSCGSSNWCYSFFAVKVCSTSSCTDATPTIAAVNNTVCSGTKMKITATGYETGATFKWQKLNGSAWEDVAGETKDSLVINPAAAANAGSYRFIATKGCARTSNTVTIAVPSAPVFGDVPASVSIMETLALSISTVEATDAVKYRWYKSADATWDAGDAEIGTEKNLIKAYDGETAGSTYYIFCRAQNACGITTSSAIAVNVTAYVEEDCATRGNEGEAEFGFDYGSAGQGSYSSTACWTMNSNSKFLTYTAPEGKYFKTAKVTIASSSESSASYNWSTNGGSTYTAVALTVNSTLTERTINLSAHGNVNSFQIGRNFNSTGSSGGTLYVSKICFEYTEACTATTVTVSGTGSETYTSGDFTEPTFTVKHGGTAFDPQPTITYTSSNEDIATVDDDGTVTFQGLAGTVKITASYAGGTISATDYCASEGYYTITVSCSAGTPSIAASGSTNLSGCNASVTLTASGVTSGGSYQWYRGGEEVDGATNASITVTQAGTYTVEYTKDGCTALSSNSIAVTSEATQPEVERLVPFQYYHVDKTYTDQMKMRHLFAVKNSGKLDGKSFKLYVSRNGGDPTDVTNSNALAIWTNADGRVDTVMIDLNKLNGKYEEDDELVYTCKAIDCSGNVSDVYKANITMHVIGATPTLALICSGSDKEGGTRKTGELTVGGDFLTGYNKADLCEQTGNTSFNPAVEWGLYTRLKANYIVTPVNGYAVFKKLNYEPFDILLLTDYPKASKSDAAKDVLDDMADLCDYRPMLSFKAHMVAKSPSKWAAKGFTTEPVAVKQGAGRIYMNIVCYAHPMFDGIKEASDHIFKDNSDASQIVYEMLTGAGYESSKGIQGFEIAAAENFVTIGLIHYNASVEEDAPEDGYVTWTPASGDRMLVAAAERQANPEARMVVLAVNCGAQSKFTETGRTIVHKCLQYLLSDHTITPMADCSFTFDNGAGSLHDADWYKNPTNCPGCSGTLGDGLWSTEANWGPDRVSLPGKDTEVKIAAPVQVDITDAVARSARIVEGGHITIPAGSALEVTGTIRHMDGSEISPTDNSEITIGSNSTGNGTLIFNNDKGDSKAVVYMYTTALADVEHMSAATSTWQYIGTPHNDVAIATYNYYDSWLYQYDTGTQGWIVIPNGGPLVPFRGYCVTHPQAYHTFEMHGTLTATTSADIEVPANKFVVAANSWVAPIDINKFTDDDFEGISDKTIYFFNTGSDTKGNGGTGTAAGTYRASPIKAAAYTGDWQIPSMQGFYIGSTTAGTLHLDYDRHVRQNGGSKVSKPMYAPQRFAEDNEPVVAKLYFRGNRYYDRLVVLEREDFTRGYDSGWDGEAWGGNSASPLSCVSGEGRWDAVSAIPEFEGTVVGFQAGEDSEYKIDFEYSEENEPLYLLDTDNNTYTRVLTGNTYQFTTSDKAYHDRFIFTRNAPSVITGIEPTSDSSQKGSAQKLLINEKVYILRNGVLYDATGKVVK